MMTYKLTLIASVLALSTMACASQPAAPAKAPATAADEIEFVAPLQHREVEFVFQSDVEEDYEGGVDDDTPWMDNNQIKLGGNVAVEDQHLDGNPVAK